MGAFTFFAIGIVVTLMCRKFLVGRFVNERKFKSELEAVVSLFAIVGMSVIVYFINGQNGGFLALWYFFGLLSGNLIPFSTKHK